MTSVSITSTAAASRWNGPAKNWFGKLDILAVERRPEACLGCGMEHDCSVHGCAVINKAADLLRGDAAYNALVNSRAKSYRLDDRELTRFDLDTLSDEIEDAERKVEELTALLNGQSARKAFGVIPRDW